MDYKLYFPTDFNNINPENDNMDVCMNYQMVGSAP